MKKQTNGFPENQRCDAAFTQRKQEDKNPWNEQLAASARDGRRIKNRNTPPIKRRNT